MFNDAQFPHVQMSCYKSRESWKLPLYKVDWASNQIKSNQIKSNQIKSNQIKSNQIKSNQIKSNQIKSNKNTLYMGTCSIKTKKYCYVVVTWHIMCRLPVTPKHKLIKCRYILLLRGIHAESQNRCSQHNLFDNGLGEC